MANKQVECNNCSCSPIQCFADSNEPTIVLTHDLDEAKVSSTLQQSTNGINKYFQRENFKKMGLVLLLLFNMYLVVKVNELRLEVEELRLFAEDNRKTYPVGYPTSTAIAPFNYVWSLFAFIEQWFKAVIGAFMGLFTWQKFDS